MSIIARVRSFVLSISKMKRKRNSEDLQACDLVLIDANGRSVRAHRALLMDKSEYFARILMDQNLKELQLNENYLIELIHYLYSHDSDYGQPVDDAQLAISPDALYSDREGIELSPSPVANHNTTRQHLRPALSTTTTSNADSNNHHLDQTVAVDLASMSIDSATAVVTPSDIEILMRLLILSKKYGFHQLYKNLKNEINYKLDSDTAIIVYKCARELGMQEFADQTRIIILSWLEVLSCTEEFQSLSEEYIWDIFGAESADIDSNIKLNALSAWWVHNKQANITDLWVNVMMSTKRSI